MIGTTDKPILEVQTSANLINAANEKFSLISMVIHNINIVEIDKSHDNLISCCPA